MASNSYCIPTGVYRFLPLIYVGAGFFALFNLTHLLGTISALLLITAGMLTFMWRCAAAVKRRRARSRPRWRTWSKTYRHENSPSPRERPMFSSTNAAGGPPDVSTGPTPMPVHETQPVSQPAKQADRSAPQNATRMDRRSDSQDRRGWQPMPNVPFRDSEGTLVQRDRRRIPERRRSSIEVRVVT